MLTLIQNDSLCDSFTFFWTCCSVYLLRSLHSKITCLATMLYDLQDIFHTNCQTPPLLQRRASLQTVWKRTHSFSYCVNEINLFLHRRKTTVAHFYPKNNVDYLTRYWCGFENKIRKIKHFSSKLDRCHWQKRKKKWINVR